MQLLDPTKTGLRAPTPEKALAPRRFTTLDGVRLGLVSHVKQNASAVLLAVGDLLAERYQLKAIVHEQKQNQTLPAPDEIVEKIARESDVVVTGVGD